MKTYKWFFLMLIASVFVACGGDSEDEYLGNWKKCGEFDGPPRGYAAYFTIGDKGYVCCGYNGNQLRRTDVYEYDNTKRSWRRMADFPGTPRQQAVGFAIGNVGYIGTGMGLDAKLNDYTMRDFWKFDPNAGPTGLDNLPAGEWTQVADLPPVAEARRSAVAFTLKVGNQEYGYIGTGYTEGVDKLSLKDFWKYDPVTDSWSSVLGFDGSKKYGAVAFVIENRAYICTGRNTSGTTGTTDLWVFDPNNPDPNKQWTERRKMYNANQDEDYDDDYVDLARWDAVAFTMLVGGEMRGHIAAGDGKYSVWEYDPKPVEEGGDLWVQRTSFASNVSRLARRGAVAFSFPSTNQAFIGLGMTGITPFEDFWEFFPLVDDDTYDDR